MYKYCQPLVQQVLPKVALEVRASVTSQASQAVGIEEGAFVVN